MKALRIRVANPENSTGTNAACELRPSSGPVEPFDSPFLGTVRPTELIEAISSHKNVTDEVFAVLDSETTKNGTTCRLVSRYQAQFFYVRSHFASAQVALVALLDGSSNIQRLRNEAVISGGVLQIYLAARTSIQAPSGDGVEFKNKPQSELTWERCCKPGYGDQDPVCIPVFCTAELSLEVISNLLGPRSCKYAERALWVINLFIKAVYYRPDWPKDFLMGIRLIDSLDLAQLQSDQTRAPLAENFISPFLHKTPQAINQIVQSQFPGTSLNCMLFAILDSFTAQDHTCILANNQSREDPFLELVRTDFHNALAIPVAITCTGLNFEGFADSSAKRGDGVWTDEKFYGQGPTAKVVQTKNEPRPDAPGRPPFSPFI